MISVEAHLTAILDAVPVLERETIPVDAAVGRTLREPVLAPSDMPAFDNSAMDGFAVHFAEVAAASAAHPYLVRVIADLPAGTASNPPIGVHEAARIMTGAPLPTDADTVVPFESTAGGLADSLGEVSIVRAPRRLGEHVRRSGEDCLAGSVVVAAGVELGPYQLAAIAAANVDRVTVTRPPRVAVISTGSELVPPGTELAHGQIPESNALLLTSLARNAGAEVVLQTTVRDDNDDLRRALGESSALGADAVITSGGVSAGAFEVVRNAVGEMVFSSIAMQPGKPQGFAAGRPLLFGLPGNPVSAAVSFEVFVRPALLTMQGRTAVNRHTLRMPVITGWPVPLERRQYMPIVFVDGGVAPATSGGSHLVGSLARAQGYAVIPVETESVAAGDLVDVLILP
ncbi:MAG TPA: molybdopterin molybdotransferase MoeA [Rhodoglobus sp.]|nr:molybdopterin molybdotransferase MoeA [Rhodoglobus sp.]